MKGKYKKGDFVIFIHYSPYNEREEKVGRILMVFTFINFPPNYMVDDGNNSYIMYPIKQSYILRKATLEEEFKFLIEENK